MKVFKYRLTPEHPCVVEMPSGAKLLHVGAQGDDLFVWALVNENTTWLKERWFYVFGTGHTIRDNLHYVGSVQMPTAPGELVWHVFESSTTHGWSSAR